VNDPLWFGPVSDGLPQGRFDAPSGEFQVLYAGLEPEAAFAETMLRDLPHLRFVTLRRARARRLTVLRAIRGLRLAQVHGPGLAQFGADAGVASGPYSVAQAWSLAIWNHEDDVDGIAYRARHDDSLIAVALFHRIAATLRHGDPRPLDSAFLAEMARRYGLGIHP
jgi:hypothetical protein